MSRSWAQVAGKSIAKPSPLRQNVTILERPPSPSESEPRSPSPDMSSPASILAAHHAIQSGAKLVTTQELLQGVKYTWANVAASRPDADSLVGPATAPSSPLLPPTDEFETLALPSSPASEESSSIISSVLSQHPSYTIIDKRDEMGNSKRQEKKEKKAQAEAAAAAAREQPMFGVSSEVIDLPALPASTPAEEAEETQDVAPEKSEKAKGKEIATSFDDEEPAGASTEAEAANKAAQPKDKEALKRAMIASLERHRRRELFGHTTGFDMILYFEGDHSSCYVHRDLMRVESTWVDQNCPPADEDGMTRIYLEGWVHNKMGPLVTCMYTGIMPGLQVDASNVWNTRFILFNVTSYRAALEMGMQGSLDHTLANLREAADYLRPQFEGRLYYYCLQNMAEFDIPFRMAFVCIYQEQGSPAEVREMKVHLAKLFVILMPYMQRQMAYKDHVRSFWDALPFPWRQELKAFRDEGILPEYDLIFDKEDKWIEQDYQQSLLVLLQPQPEVAEPLGVPGPSSDAPPFYMASEEEIAHQTGTPMY